MDAEPEAIENEAKPDELTYEPVREPVLDAAIGLILDSLRRRQPPMTIR